MPIIEEETQVSNRIDNIYEQNTVRIASCGYNRQHWESKAEIRSPRYSTRLNEILKLGNNVLQL